MKKVLFVATVVRKHINVFHLPFLELFQNKGYKTYVAASNDTKSDEVKIPFCDEYVEIAFKRNPLHPKNLKAFLKLKKVIDNNDFDIIHCHTPVGGFLCRLAAIKARRKGTKVFYTAHGFHFYEGAPLVNWLLYYPVEKICSFFTDVLITINREDYSLAKKKMKAKKVEYVPGVGIDLKKFESISINRDVKRCELGIPKNAILLISVGELSVRKNHKVILEAMTKIEDSNLHYMIVGDGPMLQELYDYANEHNILNRVHFLGFRTDIAELYKASDICCFPSVQEGLPVALMEAMASGLSIVCCKIRGNVDLLDKESAFLVNNNADEFAESIKKLIENPDLRNEFSRKCLKHIQNFSQDEVLKSMDDLYTNLP